MNDILKLTKDEKLKVMKEMSKVLFPIQISHRAKEKETGDNVVVQYAFHHTM